MKLLSVVLLLLPLSICLARVVNDFTQSCPQFFANPNDVVSPPTGFTGDRFKRICQTLNDQAEFATLYDTENRIPVYSAYRFTGLMKCKRTDKWYIEPQLENGTLGPNMDTESAVRNIVNQAENADYAGSRLHKGHLAPVFHATSQSCSDATFTLTNAAPQNPSFNSGKWKVTERAMANSLKNYCLNKNWSAFVVTGVVPGNNKMNNRVRIPSHFWTAFCCLDNNNIPIHSGAYIGENSNDFAPYRKSVLDVETELTQLYGEHFRNIIPFKFQLFDGKCYTETERAQKRKKSGCETKKRRKL
ncbi:endonuclease domain-containing 1 protein [Ictalurus punctatus]|uniref:Endonuclease domain-containing 1 protein n=1 Tax=Ictalurus punctatus TaxID=7998 RepID=A0A9F7R2E7_ICTPU|nr:endonuclease domain-containing 1 protein [Ictalurus punctatus]